MTTKTLAFKSLPQLAIAESDTTPNPGIAGVWVWSTSLSKPVYWTGSLWTAGSGGGGSSPVTGSGTVTLDFGTGSNEATVSVTGQTTILTTAKVIVDIDADSTSADHSANDHKYFGLFCKLSTGTVTAATGFTIYARSIEKLTGEWTIRYNWTN